jgi:hypothetical protein
MPYYGIFIPTGNMRDTLLIGRKLEKDGIYSYLATFETLDCSTDIRPAEPTGIKVVEDPDWFKRRTTRRKGEGKCTKKSL